jgi:hypothetical protein
MVLGEKDKEEILEKYIKLLKLHKNLLDKYKSENQFINEILFYHVNYYNTTFKKDFDTLIGENINTLILSK